jgi:hypothetical protein
MGQAGGTMQQTEPLLVTRRGDRNMKLCKPRIALLRDALQRTGARPRGLTTCAADSYRTETKVSCVAIASSRVACARKLRCTCNCEARRTRHPEASAPIVVVEHDAAPRRSASGSARRRGSPTESPDRSRTPGDAIAPYRRCARCAGRLPYRPIRSMGSPYQIITDAICCELQSRQ